MSEIIHGIKTLAEDSQRVWANICDKGLEKYIAELEVKGYTVLPPEIVAAAEDDVEEARLRLIELAKAKGAEETNFTTYEEGLSFELYHPATQGKVFERFLINPAIFTIGQYLLGERMILNNSLAYVKARTEKYLSIHSDSLMVPDPLPEYRHLVNMTIPLTDYTKEAGCIGIVPGSHKLRRHPTTPEEKYFESMVPIECPAGSCVVIPGNTWHGAFPKTDDGLRVTLVQAYSRSYVNSTVTHNIDPEIIARNPPEFARLLGSHRVANVEKENGLDVDKMNDFYLSQLSHYSQLVQHIFSNLRSNS